MKHLYTAILVTALTPFASPSLVVADEVKTSMQSLLEPLRKLQPYLANEEAFTDPENSDEIAKLIQVLRNDFHSLEEIPSRYKTLPGFKENISNVADLLDDSGRRFNEGKRAYAWWRARRIPMDCFSCHATYKVTSTYSNEAVIDSSLDPLDRARFLLATRQFSSAQETLTLVLHDPEYRMYYDEALRSLLLVVTRVAQDPKDGITLFQNIIKTADLPSDDKHTVERWIASLRSWSTSKKVQDRDELSTGEKLILTGSKHGIDFAQDDVALLRGTALVHKAIESGSLSGEQRKKALYLLGFAYAHLPQFFTEGWGEMYLEQCIEEFPNTQEAKWAFAMYKDKVLDDFTGSGGSNLPDEIKLHLEDLRKKAFGEPSLNGKV